MPRTSFLCLSIVAAFPLRLFAAGPAVVMAPVPAAALAVARLLGLEPEADRGRFLPELIRLVHGGPENRPSPFPVDVLRRAELEPAASTLRVPVPLSADVWSATIFKRRLSIDQLATAILLDRRASLIAAGLAGLDDETLEFFGDSPALLTQLYEESAAIFAAFGGSLRVHGGRVLPPGGESAVPLWEAVVGAPLGAPDRFVPLLYAALEGRVAYVYDTIAELEPDAASFALGTSMPDPAARLERFKALVSIAEREYREWKPEVLPYSRALNDLALLLLRLRVGPNGVPSAPADVAFWAEVWGTPVGRAPLLEAETGPEGLVDAAWLAEATSVGNMYDRGDRLDQLSFAQRVFTAASADAVVAVRAFPRQRMLMLTLERMGLRSPPLYAFVSNQATRLELGDSTRGFWAMAQLQPALAILSKMSMAGSIDARTSERLVRSLFSVPLDERGRYEGGIARWIARELVPALPDGSDIETRLMLGMAGPQLGDRAPRVEWEGAIYRVDRQYAEAQRLRTIRGKQGGYTVDLALDLERVAAAVASSSLDAERLPAIQQMLTALTTAHAAALSPTSFDLLAPGVSAPRRAREVVDKAAAELVQAGRTRDPRRAGRQAAPLFELADVSLGESLLSLTYAADIGDPAGTALLARNVALRHDFGLGHHDNAVRDRVMWAVPRQDFQPGVPWHVTGSALGLDIAMARLSLTRINTDRLSGAPRLSSTERDGFAVGFALLDPRSLEDGARDRIAAALATGGERVAALAAGREPFEPIADALRIDVIRQRSIRLAVAEEPVRLAERFSLAELLILGGAAPADLDPWGAGALQLTGCPCTQFLMPRTWRLLAGRPQMAFAAAALPDLNIRVAAVLAELHLPAQLSKAVLSAAVQDFIEDAAPSDSGDWWALSRAARTVSRQRIEDYVAAVASVDGALVPEETDDTKETR